jgi:uncharacterized membrane protein YcaP (DUF421 family)
MDIFNITIKLATAYIGLWGMTRILGKKEISQLTPFDFVSSLILSELVGNTIYKRRLHIKTSDCASLWTEKQSP